MWGELMFQVILVAVILWWMHRLSRDVIRALERHAREKYDDVLNSSYPVFSEKYLCETFKNAVTASRKLQQMEGAILGDPKFKDATQQHAISEDLSRQMLNVSEALVEAERCWYLHSTMMDANVAVLTGKNTRDEALAIATKRFDVTKDMFGVDASKLRDEWKSRLEDPSALINDPSPRSYSNPWFERAKQTYHWSSYAGD